MTYTLSYDSQLIDECLMTMGIAADPSQVSPLAVYQNGNGASEALVIHQGGELCHVVREPLSSSGWNVYGVGARLASAALVDGSTAYAVGNNDQSQQQGFVRTLNKGVWGTAEVAYVVAGLYQGWDGTIWAEAGQGFEQWLILQLVDGAWQTAATLTPGGPAIVSITGSAGNWWLVDAAGDVTNYAQNPQTLPPCEAGFQAIVPTPNGDIWMLDQNGVLYQLVEGQWQPAAHAPGSFAWLNADGRGNLWGIYQQSSRTPSVLGYAGSGGVWQQLETPPATSATGVSVGADASLLMLDQNGVAWIMAGGPGGTWQRQMTPTGMYGVTSQGQVTEVVAGQDAQGNWHAFYVEGGNLYQLDYGDGGWGTNDFITQVGGQIGLTNDQTSGELIGYGVSADGNFLVFQNEGGGTFQSSEYNAGGALSGATPNLTVINDDMWVTTAVIGGRLTQIWGAKAGPTTYPGTPVEGFFPVNETNTLNGPQDMQRVLRLPWVQAESGLPYAVVMDDDGNIFMVSDLELVISLDPATEISQGTYTLLAGAGVSAMGGVTGAGAVMGADGYARIYATDESYQVWLMRQTGGGDTWTWSQWHPLGDNCSYLANGPGALQTTELFTISADNLLYLIDQNADTQRWESSLVKRPAGAAEDFDELTLYKTEVAVLDGDGNPAAGIQVSVQAAEPALLWVEGVQYTLAAGDTVSGTTNAMGKVRITTPAAGLHTSPLALSLEGAGPQTVYAPQHVHDFLAGNAALGAGRTFTADGAALTNATDYNGDPYAGFPGMAQNPNVPAASAVIMQLAQAQPQGSVARATAFLREPAAATAALGESFWDKVWGDMVNYAEDVFYAIRNGVIKVVDVVYDAVHSVVTATVQFVGDAVKRVIKFVVSTYHDIANALHTAFQWIEAGVDKLLDWLKSLFDWKSILYTQQVFAYYMGQAIPWLQQQVKEGEVLVNNFFQNLEGDVEQWFDWLKQFLGAQTVNDTGSDASTGTQINFKGMKFLAGIFHFGTGVNWLLEKVESYIFGSSAESLNPVAIVQQAAQTFWNVSQPAWQDLYNAVESFRSFVQGAVSHPGDFKQLVASDLVNSVEDVILAALQFADAVVETFLALVEAALNYVDELLTYNIDIPLVTKLYEKYVGQPLTALNLFTMLLAVPVTVGYKLASGSRYLFTEQQVQQITGGSDAHAERAEAIPVDGELQSAFYFCSGAVTLVWAAFDTALDAYQQTPPLGLQIMDIIFPTVLQVFGWPSGVPFTSIPMETKAEKWGFGNWIVGWAPIPLNVALLLVGRLLDPESSKVARYSDPVGKGILTGVGLLNLGVGAAASGLGQKDGSVSGAGVAANTLSPMANLFQWLRLSELEEASEELTYYIKLLVDFFTGAGTAVSIFVEGSETS